MDTLSVCKHTVSLVQVCVEYVYHCEATLKRGAYATRNEMTEIVEPCWRQRTC